MKNRKIRIFTAVICLLAGCTGCYCAGFMTGRSEIVYQANANTAVCPDTAYSADNAESPDIEKILPSIVMMDIYDSSDKRIAGASGFVALEPCRLVTCRHVLINMSYAICTTESGETFRVDTICEADEENDIALCVLPDDCMIPGLKTADKVPKRGDSITAVGSPFGLVNVVTCGNVSMVKDTYILFTAPVNSGSSGGVLLNDSGEVCGVVRGTYGDGQGINVAVPIERVTELGIK